MTLVRVRHPLSFRPELISPNEWFARESAARGKFPFRLSWQTLMCPFRISFGIFVSYLDDRIIFFSFHRTIRAGGVSPVCAFDVAPPLKVIIQGNRMIGRSENHSTSN